MTHPCRLRCEPAHHWQLSKRWPRRTCRLCGRRCAAPRPAPRSRSAAAYDASAWAGSGFVAVRPSTEPTWHRALPLQSIWQPAWLITCPQRGLVLVLLLQLARQLEKKYGHRYKEMADYLEQLEAQFK